MEVFEEGPNSSGLTLDLPSTVAHCSASHRNFHLNEMAVERNERSPADLPLSGGVGECGSQPVYAICFLLK